MKEERAEAGPKVGRGGLVSKCGILLWPHIIKILYYGLNHVGFWLQEVIFINRVLPGIER